MKLERCAKWTEVGNLMTVGYPKQIRTSADSRLFLTIDVVNYFAFERGNLKDE